MTWTQILGTLALAFTISAFMVARHMRGGALIWLGWLTGATTIAMFWSWTH